MKLLFTIAIGLITAVQVGGAQAQTLEKIKQNGVISVGVKGDYPPLGYRDTSGNLIGLEPDLAQDVAEQLGVKVELVPVQTANRIEFLQQGRIDLIIAGMGDSEQRRKVVGIIDPPYYAGATAILARNNANLKTWEDLRGQPVCATQGAYYNRPVAQKYGVNIVAFPGVPEGLAALRAGSCVAFLQDMILIRGLLASNDPQWKEYGSPLPLIDPAPTVIAVPLAEKDGPYGKKIQEIVREWHSSGKLIELEKEWMGTSSDFVIKMNDESKEKSN